WGRVHAGRGGRRGGGDGHWGRVRRGAAVGARRRGPRRAVRPVRDAGAVPGGGRRDRFAGGAVAGVAGRAHGRPEGDLHGVTGPARTVRAHAKARSPRARGPGLSRAGGAPGGRTGGALLRGPGRYSAASPACAACSPASPPGPPGATAALATASVALTVVFSGKWQAAWWPGLSSTSGGSTCLQMSCAFQQRVWKRQAGGGSRGLGTSPCSRIRLRSPRSAGSGIGTA